MSGQIYPVLPGQKFPKRIPDFNSKRQKALSGKESAINLRAYPLVSFSHDFELLSDQHPILPARTNYVLSSLDATTWSVSTGGVGFVPQVISNQALAPDGTLTADRVIFNIAAGTTSADLSVLSVPVAAYPTVGTQLYTFSVWLKTNDGSTVAVAPFGSNLGGLWTVTPTWQRFSTSGDPAVVSNPGILLVGNGGTAKYADLSVWGAQFETGGNATLAIRSNGAAQRQSDLKTLAGFISQMMAGYDTFLHQDPAFNTVLLQQFATGNATATAFNLTATYQPGAEIAQYNGAVPPVLGPAGSPEWIQNTNGPPQIYTARYGVPELLTTGPRTNLSLQSNLAATWVANAGTITINSLAAPDGTTTAAKFTENTAAAAHDASLAQTAILTANTRYTHSVWLKYGSCQYVGINLDDNSTNGTVALFDLLNGLVVGTFKAGTSYSSAADVTMTAGPNGWFRCSITGQFASTTVRLAIVHFSAATPAFYPSFTGTSRFTYIWGDQLELGSLATALIPVTTAHVLGGSDYTLTTLTTVGTVNSFQQVSFTLAPPNNAPLLWSGSFYYRCRFIENSFQYAEDMNGVWSLKTLGFDALLL